MSISATLSNALSGLNATAKRAEVVSSNVANASTPGYGRRVVELAGSIVNGAGAGVSVSAVRREVDPILIGDRRLAEAALGAASTEADGLARIERSIGVPDEPGSLGGRIAALEATLIEAASRPESEARQAGVLDAAKGLTRSLSAISTDVQEVRARADAAIATDVAFLNDALTRVQDLNEQILRSSGGGRDTNALFDSRQQIVDSIAAIVPLREVERGSGQIALFTPGGAILLDGPARTLTFTPATLVTPEMTLAAGGLSGLQIDGIAVPVGTAGSPIAGGTLAANFALRDIEAPEIQTRLDGIARDLLTRFEDADATLAPGAPGLFTDAGGAFNPLAETGLAARISVNQLADPAAGGALWRIRDGLGATVAGQSGAAGGLTALSDALATSQAPGSTAFSAVPRSVSGLAADLLSGVAQNRVSAEAEQGFVAARHGALRAQELQGGVDTDAEMADLLRIEQAYAANARVLQTVDELIQILIRT